LPSGDSWWMRRGRDVHGDVVGLPFGRIRDGGDDVPRSDRWRLRRGGDVPGNIGDVPREWFEGGGDDLPSFGR
jgi:hypothetical protein